CQQYTPWNTF
nr:immunoglobulin light chain junction region [Macaca mulatta]MOW40012.1 immunoglobulin light chain junction region [Macaca mulatta]MOW40099.1 immunoglobulin light chain junction region [Macaca mulatta]MOW40268.1 immunoglobulin light chain junction region [Macaca mulatta]MOW40567.1 immunoglobulin light chain junction region [Macaca mulatta]